MLSTANILMIVKYRKRMIIYPLVPVYIIRACTASMHGCYMYTGSCRLHHS